MRAPFDANDIARFAEGFAANVVETESCIPTTILLASRLPGTRKVIRPKSDGQRRYLSSILDNDIVIGIGPAGHRKDLPRCGRRGGRPLQEAG